MADSSIIDTHVHLWDNNALRYPWLDSVPAIRRPFLPDDYRSATARLNVAQLVFVECGCAEPLRETQWIAQLAEREPRITAIVAKAPLEKGEAARDEIDSLLAASPRVKGIRRLLQGEADPAFCLRPDFVRGVQLLAGHNLHFEICIKGAEQLRSSIELVQRCPDVRFVLNHIAKPMIVEGLMQPWADLLTQLASLPNVWCKISGVVTEADFERWTQAQIAPYVIHALDSFGIERCMFGGDWPVVTLAASYRRWVETLGSITAELSKTDLSKAGLSEAERRALYHDNARQFYRLPATAPQRAAADQQPPLRG